MEVAIEISAVTKRYEHFKLQDVSLQIPKGTIVGLIEQNGAGKTTLFNCILNLVGRDSGSVRLPGLKQDTASEKIRRFVGYLPERLSYYEWMTVEALLRFASAFYENWDSEHCRNLMKRYELEPRRKVKELSMGMRKKLGLMLALAHRPWALILDEPTSGLDPVMKFHFLQDLRRNDDSGETEAILVSSHNLDEVERLVDRIAILRLGELQCRESREKFLEGRNKVVFVPPSRLDWTHGSNEKIHYLRSDRAMIVSRQETGPLVGRLTTLGGSISEISRPSLEEIFLQLA